MPEREDTNRNHLSGLPVSRVVPSPVFASSLTQALAHHYHSFLAFQQQAMVLSQMMHSMAANRRRSLSPDSSVSSYPTTFPQHFNLSPTGDPHLRIPSAFPELEDLSPLHRAPSDHGYCSSVTSEARSKSRSPAGSETSSNSKSTRMSPDSAISKPFRSPSSFDENSRSTDGFGFIQAPEITSSIPGLPLIDEDSQKGASKYLPSFCDESNQSMNDLGVEIKIEPLDSDSDSNPHVSSGEEADFPGKINSDVMWSVKPLTQVHPFIPTPDESSNDPTATITKAYLNQKRPFAQFAPLEPDTKRKKSKVSIQTEAIDLSIPKKRKAKSPKKENIKKRSKKDFASKTSNPLASIGPIPKSVILLPKDDISESLEREKQIWKRDPIHVLQTSVQQNIKTEPEPEHSQITDIPQSAPQPKRTKDKKFPCSVCNKIYSQRSSLHTHMRIHTGVRPYQCKDCGRSFTDCSTYIKHCRLHTGEKPYACSVCGRCFTQSGNMMRHQAKCSHMKRC